MFVTARTGLSLTMDWGEYVNNINSYNWWGYQDDMFSLKEEWLDGYGMRFEALFVAPTTGYYQFRISCDDICEFNLGESEETKTRVVDYRTPDKTSGWFQHV